MLSVISITIFFILYFFKLPSKSINFLLSGEVSNIDYFFTFLGIDSQSWFPASNNFPAYRHVFVFLYFIFQHELWLSGQIEVHEHGVDSTKSEKQNHWRP